MTSAVSANLPDGVSPMTSDRPTARAGLARHAAAILILILFLGLGVVYSISTPVMEASDEIRHYPLVRHLAAGGGLPVQVPAVETEWNQEGSQPPLYYVVMAALTARIDATDLPLLLRLNPHAEVGVPAGSGNKNHVLHTPREAFPWTGATLAIHIIRLASLLLGAGTILLTYALTLTLFPDEPAMAVGAMGLNAFIPMFLFISASVNNDNAVTFLSSLALLMMVRLVLRGVSLMQLLLLGLVIGLACLSKLGALGLIPLAGLAVGLRVLAMETGEAKRSRLGRWLGSCLVIVLPVLLVAGWWYLRNWRLYGDPTGLAVMLDIAGRRPVRPGAAQLYQELQGFRMSFWGVLGAFDVLLRPQWVYRVLDKLTMLSLVGLVVWAATRWRKRGFAGWPALLVPAVWIVVEFAGLIRWTSETAASQGRLMFPAISAICMFLALGWLGMLPRLWQRVGAGVISVSMFLLAAITPFVAIQPAYAVTAEWLEGSIPATARPAGLDYGGKIRLRAFELSADRLVPGEPLEVTLYWEALAPIEKDYSVSISLFGWEQPLDGADSYPGGSAFPTSWWPAGRILRDRYRLLVPEDTVGSGKAWLTVGMNDFGTRQPLPIVDAHGNQVLLPVIADFEIAPGRAVWQPSARLDANLGGQARITGYDVSAAGVTPGDEWQLQLYWQALALMEKDYTVFVHVVDEAGRIVAQTDVPPTRGFYPTSRWETGASLRDSYRLTIPEETPPGDYNVRVGLYDPVTGARLSLLDAAGQPVDNEVNVTQLHIDRP